jgi:hypothetical protein
MWRTIAKVTGFAAALIAGGFSMLYLIDASMQIFGFSVTKTVPLDFFYFSLALGSTVLFLCVCAHALKPRGGVSDSFFRPRAFLYRMLVSIVVTFILSMVIEAVWLATEL